MKRWDTMQYPTEKVVLDRRRGEVKTLNISHGVPRSVLAR